MTQRVKIPRFKDLPINRKFLVIIMAVSVSALLLSWGSFSAHEMISMRGAILVDLETSADVAGQNCSAALLFDDQADASETLAALKAKKIITHAMVFSEKGGVLASYLSPGQNGDLLPAKPGKEGHYFKNDSVCLYKGIYWGGETNRHYLSSVSFERTGFINATEYINGWLNIDYDLPVFPLSLFKTSKNPLGSDFGIDRDGKSHYQKQTLPC